MSNLDRFKSTLAELENSRNEDEFINAALEVCALAGKAIVSLREEGHTRLSGEIFDAIYRLESLAKKEEGK